MIGQLQVIINFKDEFMVGIDAENIKHEDLIKELSGCFIELFKKIASDIDYTPYYKDSEDPKGDLEVIVNYLNEGMIKHRSKEIKVAEIPYVLRNIFLAIIQTQQKLEKGVVPKNVFKVYGSKQFEAL